MLSRHRWIHLPYNHGEPIWRCRYDVVAVTTFFIAGIFSWIAIPLPTHGLIIPLHHQADETIDPLGTYTEAITIGTVTDGQPTWEGKLVSMRELKSRLNAIASLAVTPGIWFAPADDALYGNVLPVLKAIKLAGLADSRFCFAGTSRNGDFSSEYDARLMITLVNGAAHSRAPPRSEFRECDPRLIMPRV